MREIRQTVQVQGDPVRSHPVLTGRVTTPCPNGCAFTLDTNCAALCLTGDDSSSIRWTGVPCDVCGATFTIETDKPLPGA